MKPVDYILLLVFTLVVISMFIQYFLVPKSLRPYANFTLTPFGSFALFGIPAIIAYRLWG